MQEAFEKASKLITESSTILLTMHERMDGDDGGALLAIGAQLEQMGKQVTYAIKKGVPPNLSFLPGAEKILDETDEQNFDLLITFGCSELKRTGNPKILNLKCKILNIDHHPDNAMFGDVNMVDAKKSSVAELVYEFFVFNNWKISKEIATCLLTGIITDTGGFMHANTQSSTLKTASELLRKGAMAHKIIQQTFKNKNTKTLKAWGKAIENVYYDKKNKVIYSIITEQDLEEIGKLPEAAFEGLAETLNTFPDAKFSMFLRQDGSQIKGSLRSDSFKNMDVNAIAKIFGGGGHKLASGFSIMGKLTKDENEKWKIV